MKQRNNGSLFGEDQELASDTGSLNSETGYHQVEAKTLVTNC